MNTRWHLVMGRNADDTFIDLSTEEIHIEGLLETVYGEGGSGGFARSSLKVRKWLEGIRKYFSKEIVSILQKDALERQSAKEMLLEPELLGQLEPDINLVAAILNLEYLLPEKTKQVARQLVERLVNKMDKKLKSKLVHAVRRGLSQESKLVYPQGIRVDWKRTIERNIKNYQKTLEQIVPDRWYGYKNRIKLKEIYLLIDRSDSMINSSIHASIIGAILASINSLKTHLIFFDTEVSDFTEKYQDPVDILFNVPIGGGTDIGHALSYVNQKMRKHAECLLFLISDLDEGGSISLLLHQLESLKAKGTSIQCLLCLDDQGAPDYNRSIAEQISSLKIPVYSSNPEDFPDILSFELAKL